MPVKIPNNLPAVELLKEENIFVMDQLNAERQDIRPLRLLILNLMPVKITTETDFIRLLSNTPLQIEITFLMLSSHTSKNTSQEHIAAFYETFDTIKDDFYDGMIITGAPVEMHEFEDVTYWNEITQIFDWARQHVTSTLYICWAAQAALYRYYRVKKVVLPEKIFGVFKHTVSDKQHLLFRGFDDEFFIPHSRHTKLDADGVVNNKDLNILATSAESGIGIITSRGGREFYLTGHSEYSPLTLDGEYKRDIEKGMNIKIPTNYYKDNDPLNAPIVRWKAHGNLLFTNWLNYFVYQETPYDKNKIGNLGYLPNK